MSYELRLPPDTQSEIKEYVSERFEGRIGQEAAAAAIVRELEKLAINPGLGSSRPGGPFEDRFVYQFAFSLDGTTRYIQVAYKLHKQDRVLVVSGLKPLEM